MYINEMVLKSDLLEMGQNLDKWGSGNHWALLCGDIVELLDDDGVCFVDSSKHERRYAVALATPKWLPLTDWVNIYARCPKGLSVDHIVPLRSPNVCGLHVPWNIQYITLAENKEKSNTFELLIIKDR